MLLPTTKNTQDFNQKMQLEFLTVKSLSLNLLGPLNKRLQDFAMTPLPSNVANVKPKSNKKKVDQIEIPANCYKLPINGK